MIDPRKLVEEAQKVCDGLDTYRWQDYELIAALRDALTAALDREADGEAGWTAAEMGEPLDDAQSVQWLDGWEYYTALGSAERAETELAHWREAAESVGESDGHGWVLTTRSLSEIARLADAQGKTPAEWGRYRELLRSKS